MQARSWHFFIPVNPPLPVPDGEYSIKHSSTFHLGDNGEKWPGADGALLLIHREQVKGSLLPELQAASQSLDRRRVQAYPNSRDIPQFEDDYSISVVEVVVSTRLIAIDSDDDNGEDLSLAFNFALDQLNVYLKALSITVDYPIQSVRRESLPPFLPVAIGAFEPSELETQKLPRVKPHTLLNLNLNSPNIGDNDYHGMVNRNNLSVALSRVSIPGPFKAFHDFKMEAHHHHYISGNYRIAISLYASACETLFDDLLQHILWEEGIRPEDAANFFYTSNSYPKAGKRPFPISITKMVESRLLPKLESSTLNSKLVIDNWKTHIAHLRNRSIHRGYVPDQIDIENCAKAFSDVIQFVSNSIDASSDTYPFTRIAFFGLPKCEAFTSDVSDDMINTSQMEGINELFRVFNRWSRYVEMFRSSASEINQIANPNDCTMLITQSGNDRLAFAMHTTFPAAVQIPSENLSTSSTFKLIERSMINTELSSTIESVDVGGFDLPPGTTFDRYPYDIEGTLPVMLKSIRP